MGVEAADPEGVPPAAESEAARAPADARGTTPRSKPSGPASHWRGKTIALQKPPTWDPDHRVTSRAAVSDAAAEIAAGRSPDSRQPARRRSRWGLAVALTLLVVGLGWTASWARMQVVAPFDPAATTPVIVHIPPGMRLRDIAGTLKQRGLVRSAWGFRLLAVRDRRSRGLQAGTYALAPSMTPRQILLVLANGKVATVRVTIPEGWDARQVVAGLAAAGLGVGPDLARAVDDPSLLAAAALPAPAPGTTTALEGYLYPATYAFPPDASARQVLSRMVQQFQTEWTPDLAAAAQSNSGLTTLAAVTLASIVQREVADPTEMPVVAGLYLHRLRIGMKLDADPTVLYAMGVEAQQTPLSASELEVDSPYNTYRYAGLPPGPICNPGVEALQAVAHPLPTNAIYFLTAADGHVVLAETLAEQLANRRKYLGY